MSHFISIVDILSEGASSLNVPRYSQVVISCCIPNAAEFVWGTDLTNRQVQRLRPGFLMYSNTKVKNIAYQGKDPLDQRRRIHFRQWIPVMVLLVYDDVWWFMHSIDTISIYIP